MRWKIRGPGLLASVLILIMICGIISATAGSSTQQPTCTNDVSYTARGPDLYDNLAGLTDITAFPMTATCNVQVPGIAAIESASAIRMHDQCVSAIAGSTTYAGNSQSGRDAIAADWRVDLRRTAAPIRHPLLC